MSPKLCAASLLQETANSGDDGCLGSHIGHLAANTSLQSCPALPLELEYMVIDHLHEDIVSLKAASLVCKDWTTAARRHLFHTIQLTGVNQLLRFSADVPLIPDIRESVQVLEICGEEDQSLAPPQPLSIYANFVIDTVASMPRLLEVHFAGVPMAFTPFAINPPLRPSLTLLTYVMRDCSPEDFQCMLHVIGLFSEISSVVFAIRARDIDGQAMAPPEHLLQAGALPPYGPVKLRCLKIMALDYHWLALLLSALRHVGALQDPRLEVHLWRNGDDAAAAIEGPSAARMSLEGYGAFFRGLGSAVLLLEVDLLRLIAATQEELSGNLSATLGLSALTNLRWLSLYLDVPNELDGAQVILTAALRAYTEIFATTPFPALNVVFLHLIADGDEDEGEIFCNLDWSPLASALLGLPALLRFGIRVRCNRPRPPMCGRYLQDLMPLHEAGKLSFHVEEEIAEY